MSIAPVPLGPFRGFVPFDEGAADVFFGRATESDALVQRVMSETGRVVVVTGESGVGKTSLVRAGLGTGLAKRELPMLYITDPTDLDGEVLRAANRVGGSPRAPGEATADYVARLCRESRAGLVLVIDHVEEALVDEAPAALAQSLANVIARAADAAGTRLRLVLVVDTVAFPKLDRLPLPPAFRPTPGAWMNVERLDEETVADILDRTAVHSGTFFEAGLPAVVAADLCRDRRCSPLELQLCARAMVDNRLTSIRKYQAAGGIPTLKALFFDQACAAAGGAPARRILLELAVRPACTVVELEERTQLPRPLVVEALRALGARGVVRKRQVEPERYALAHPALASYVEAFGIEDRARAESVRRRVRARLAGGSRLSLRELFAVRTTLGAGLMPAEAALFRRSLRSTILRLGIAAIVVIGLLVTVLVDARQSYVLAFDPPGGGAAARVVVREGRPRRGIMRLFPHSTPSGAVVADTGFSAAGLASVTVANIRAGQAGGAMEADTGAGAPAWLRDVINGLRPVPRGVAKALIGDADGVTSLKQAFSDPLARRETLDALAVIGRGRAGEDEILAAALADAAPEIRRRGVEVAAEIDRRLGNGVLATTLRSALSDRSLDVRMAVLHELPTLPAGEAAELLAAALADRDGGFRRAAEQTALALASTAPNTAAEAAEKVLQSADGGVRRNALALFEQIATRAPDQCQAVLARVVMNDHGPEEARIAALQILRRGASPPPALIPVLERAVAPAASPRLRAAALPLYARLIDPVAAQDIARGEMKGPAAARVVGAAVWGAVAVTRPDLAAKPLKALVYDPLPDVRVEAARAYQYLKREGLPLVEKILRDPNTEVQKAGIESALVLAPINPYMVGTMLGKGIPLARPAMRRRFVEALGRLGQSKAAAALPPLAHALKDADPGTRAAVAVALCALTDKNAVATSPYLRMAARDEARDVRAAAAACVDEVAVGDPRGAAKMATELADAAEAPVRVAAAGSLGRLAARMPDLALSGLLRLLADPDPAVRAAAVSGLVAFGDSAAGGPGFSESKRGSDTEHALLGAMAQGDVALRLAAVDAAAKNRLPGVLRQATTDGDETVRLAAVRAAGALSPPALDVVRAAVDDRAPAVHAQATRILAGASGAGAKEVLPIYEAALRGGDHDGRLAAVLGLGELTDAAEPAARLLAEALHQRSESVRTAAAAALGRLADKAPGAAVPALERALHDRSYDVASSAVPGLARAWSHQLAPGALGDTLRDAETDSARRFAALEALVLRATRDPDPKPALAVLTSVANDGPPLARLAAQLGRAFLAGRGSASPAGEGGIHPAPAGGDRRGQGGDLTDALPPPHRAGTVEDPQTILHADLHAFLERLLGG